MPPLVETGTAQLFCIYLQNAEDMLCLGLKHKCLWWTRGYQFVDCPQGRAQAGWPPRWLSHPLQAGQSLQAGGWMFRAQVDLGMCGGEWMMMAFVWGSSPCPPPRFTCCPHLPICKHPKLNTGLHLHVCTFWVQKNPSAHSENAPAGFGASAYHRESKFQGRGISGWHRVAPLGTRQKQWEGFQLLSL